MGNESSSVAARCSRWTRRSATCRRGDVLIEDDTIVAVEPEIDADAEVVDATGPDRDPRLRRHPPAHLGGGDPQLRPERHPRRLLRRGARHVRAAVPARGRLRQQPGRLARVPQRRHHHAGRLVAHQQHPRAPRRRRPAACRRPASAPSTPTAAPTPRWPTTGSTARSPSPATTCAGSATPTSPPTTACSPWAWPPAAPASAQDEVVQAEWGARPRAGHPDHRARGAWAGWPAGSAMVKQLHRAGPARARTPPTSTAATSASEEWQLVKDSGGTHLRRAAGRAADGPRLAAGDQGAASSACARACRSTS